MRVVYRSANKTVYTPDAGVVATLTTSDDEQLQAPGPDEARTQPELAA